MSRTRVTFIIGTLVALAGLALRLGAHALGTTWESLGPNAWGGTTDPSAEGLYQTVCLTVFVIGLVLLALAFGRRLFTERAMPRLPIRHAPR